METSYQTKVKIVYGKFAMGFQGQECCLVGDPIPADLTFNEATNGLLVRIVGLMNCVCFGYIAYLCNLTLTPEL